MPVFNFELVSPEAKLVSEPMTLVEMPSDEGMFGVMAGHKSMLSSLGAGVIRMHKEVGQVSREVFIASGFADVEQDRLTVLAEEAIDVKDLDLASLEQYLKDLYEDLEMAEGIKDKAAISAKITLTKAKITAVAGI